MRLSRLLVLCAGVFAAHALPVANAQRAADAGEIARTLRAGDRLEDVLNALNARGFRVVYSSALVLPDMKLAAAPHAQDIDWLLGEMLAPFKLKAIRAANGDWLIIAAAVPPPAAPAITETIESIDVTASRYALASADASATFLERHEVERMPHLADDAVRMLKVLPGVSGGDFSAALNIRGGRRDETLLEIDGAEIHDGFHFRDLTGAFSVVDTHLVDSIDFTTGGMTADRGDYMSGVVDMRTRRPRAADEYRSVVGVSFVSAYGRTGGAFADDRGSWLVAMRRGYLDVLMEQVQDDTETITPRYADLFASVDYDIGERTKISGRLLLGTDDLKLVTHDQDEVDSAGKGDAGHAWLSLDQRLGDAVSVVTTLSTSRVRHTRDAAGEDDYRYGDVAADFDFRFVDLRQDWSWALGDRNLLRFGANGGWASADYQYRLDAGIYDLRAPGGVESIARASDLKVSGSKYGLHAAWRASPIEGLTTELGVRRDSYRYPGGRDYGVTSPRLNLVWRLDPESELRAAWGVIHQPQGVDSLQVEDGVTEFFAPERVRSAVLGYSRRFGHGFSARIDAYQKDYSHLHPRFENALDSMQLIPESAVDRVRIDATEAEARGVELTLRREAERGLAGWVSVAFARARDRDADRWASRLWEQRQTLSFGTSWTGTKWNVSLAGSFHDGTPTTRLGTAWVDVPGRGLVPIVEAEARNDARLGSYQRIDLRANRDVTLRSGRMSYYLEVTNLLDRKNPCCVEGHHTERRGDDLYLVFDQSSWLPLMPSFGIQFEF